MVDSFMVSYICRKKLGSGLSKQNFIMGPCIKFGLLFSKISIGSRLHPVLFSVGTGVLCRWCSGRGVKLATLVHLVPGLRMCGATLPFSVDRNNGVIQSELPGGYWNFVCRSERNAVSILVADTMP